MTTAGSSSKRHAAKGARKSSCLHLRVETESKHFYLSFYFHPHMEPTDTPDPCHDMLLSMRRQLREANLKLDHIIYRLQDDYYRQFYDLYGKHLDG